MHCLVISLFFYSDLGDNEALQQKLEMLNAMVEQENGKDPSRRMMFSAHCKFLCII